MGQLSPFLYCYIFLFPPFATLVTTPSPPHSVVRYSTKPPPFSSTSFAQVDGISWVLFLVTVAMNFLSFTLFDVCPPLVWYISLFFPKFISARWAPPHSQTHLNFFSPKSHLRFPFSLDTGSLFPFPLFLKVKYFLFIGQGSPFPLSTANPSFFPPKIFPLPPGTLFSLHHPSVICSIPPLCDNVSSFSSYVSLLSPPMRDPFFYLFLPCNVAQSFLIFPFFFFFS